MTKLDFGKYRGIIISVVLFLLLDASVLIMNFYISFEIADDAVGVNVAGRQRMLSQRTMKSLFDIDTSIGNPTEMSRSVGELEKTTKLFDQTLTAFRLGGETTAPDGTAILLPKVTSSASLEAVNKAFSIWEPYAQKIAPLLDPRVSYESVEFKRYLDEAIAYGRDNNLTLLTLMNTLTVDLEKIASSKADTLRLIQTVGISLAILNFFIIMFHTIRQLRESDEKIEEAQNETKDILNTVNEGLFLMSAEGEIGEQYSAELEEILGQKDIHKKTFEELLSGIVSEKDMNTAQGFLNLLFNPHKKEKLLGSLNPLKEVAVHISNAQGLYDDKFLSFNFRRVLEGKSIRHVLVTTTDITKQVQLAKELEGAKRQNEQQIETLTTLLKSDPKMLPVYIRSSFSQFNEINTLLKAKTKTDAELREKADDIFTIVHNFKGESSALGFDQYVTMAHALEEHLVRLREKSDISGNDFFSMTIQLNQLISTMEGAEKIISKLSAFSANQENHDVLERQDWSHLQSLADDIAARQGKSVEVIHSGLNDFFFEESFRQKINHLCVQLIRNAITHGIETLEGREAVNKPTTGEVNIRFTRRLSGDFQMIIQDDGHGLDFEKIHETAAEKGLIKDPSAAPDKKTLLSLIFSPALSTRDVADEDAGRGMGLPAVRSTLKKMGGRVSISSQRGKGCHFTLTIPVPEDDMHNVA